MRTFSLKVSLVIAFLSFCIPVLTYAVLIRNQIRKEVSELRESMRQLRQDVEDLHHDVNLVDERIDQIESDFFD